MPRLVFTLACLLTFTAVQAQQLKITHTEKNKKTHTYRLNNLVSVYYTDTANAGFRIPITPSKYLNYAQGRLRSITDSTIELEQVLSSKRLTIPLSRLAAIERNFLSLQILTAAAGLVGVAYVVDQTIDSRTFTIVTTLLAVPVILSVADNLLLDPLHIVHPDYYRRKNRWELEVLPGTTE